MKNSVQDKAVQAHVFEYTCTMGLTPDMKFKFASTDKGMVPTQIIFCLKEKNAKWVKEEPDIRSRADNFAVTGRSTVTDGSSMRSVAL